MKNREYIIAIDIGTTLTKGILYRVNAGIEDTAVASHQIHCPLPGIVEQDPDEVCSGVERVIYELSDRIKPSSINALVFGGILHSFIPVDSKKKPLNRALIWADLRSLEECEALRERIDIEEVKRRTGCTLHPLYFLPRIIWFRDRLPDIFKKTWKFISIKEYVLLKLFGSLLVDRSIASGTGIWNMHTMDWDEELLGIAGIGKERLSPVVELTTILRRKRSSGNTKSGLPGDVPVVIGGGDGPLAHLGSAGLKRGMMSLTVGTSGAVRRSTPQPEVLNGKEAWCYYLGENNWITGGVIHDAGVVLQWLSTRVFDDSSKNKTNINILREDIFKIMNEALKNVPPGSEGLIFLPILGGERTPHYNPSARGALIGMSYAHSREHILRALIEGIAYRLLSVYEMLSPEKYTELVVTGGILKSPSWMQIIADFFGKRLLIPAIREAAAWGAVLIAMKALGMIETLDKVENYVRIGGHIDFNPEAHLIYKRVREIYDSYYKKIYE
jgi:gluconokinase